MAKNTSRKRGAKKKAAKLTLMQRFGLFFYDKREVMILYLLALAVFGVLSYTLFMQRQGFPGIDVPYSVINGTYFVSDRQKVDADITLPASKALAELPQVEQITSQAGDNSFVIIAQYQEGVSSQEGSELVKKTLEEKNIIPEVARIEYKPINGTKFADEYDLLVSVYDGKDSSPRQLTAAAERVAGELEGRDGIDQVAVLKQIESGINPATGAATTELRRYDRVGVRENGNFVFYPSASIGIAGGSDGDALKLSDDVHAALDTIRQQPGNESIRLSVTADFAEGINDQIQGLQRSLLEGLVAVVLICFLLISWRASLTAAIAMLSVILITLGVLYTAGNTLNTITLFALILSLGLIVDDTVIMVEAIDAAKNESRKKRDIAAIAIKRVALASTAGTLTTMLAFAPMLFIGGILGDFIRIMPATVIISLAVSLLVSITLVPLLASGIILRKSPKPSRNPVLKLESLISGGLSNLILVGKRSRLKGALISLGAFAIAAVMIGASIPAFQALKFNIFPNTKDTNTLRATIFFPPATPITQAQKLTDDINGRIHDALGDNLRRVAYMNTGSSTEAEATIDLIHYDERAVTSVQLTEKLQAELDRVQGARIKVNQLDTGPPEDELPFKAQIFTEDNAKAKALANDIATYLDGRSVERQNGGTARIVGIEITNPAQLVRTDTQKMIEVRAGFDADDTSALVVAAQDLVTKEFTPERLSAYGLEQDDLRFDFGFESESQESFGSLFVALPILLLVMYVLMALQFKSFLQPLLIFMAIPFSFFGVATGLRLSDNPLSFFVMIGFFALIGIAVNNAILLTDYANQAKVSGMGRIDAIAYSVRARFRPLVTTSLTSIVALVPLALSDPFWEALSITLISGLLSSMFLVVVVFPYIYLAGEVLKVFGHKLWIRQLPSVVQYPLDILIAPVRLAGFLLYIIFRHKPGAGI